MNLKEVELKLFDWAQERDLLSPERIDRQFMKIAEELGELAEAIGKDRREDIQLEIGDVFVTIALLAFQNGLSLEDCAVAAFRKIEHRKGKLINGTFVKEEDL